MTIQAKLIGEKSGGLTAVEIWDKDELVWSHLYLRDGCADAGYRKGLHQAYKDMVGAANWATYDGCDRDDDGDVIQYSVGDDEIVICDPIAHLWTRGQRMGQSDEILDALILAGLIEHTSADDYMLDDNGPSQVAEYIRARIIK